MVKVIENKYKNQIKEMLESHQCLQTELTSKNRRLDEDNRQHTQTQAISQKEMEIERSQLELRAQELSKTEACLRNDLNELRTDRDRKV